MVVRSFLMQSMLFQPGCYSDYVLSSHTKDTLMLSPLYLPILLQKGKRTFVLKDRFVDR